MWPEVRSRDPGAVLHLYAAESERPASLPEGVRPHPPPSDSRDASAPNAVLVVPLRIASGVRMKILEAWARGVPVVATAEAVAGLGAEKGRTHLVLEEDGGVEGVVRIADDPHMRAGIGRAGRAVLASDHAPVEVAGRLLTTYLTAASLPGSSQGFPMGPRRLEGQPDSAKER